MGHEHTIAAATPRDMPALAQARRACLSAGPQTGALGRGTREADEFGDSATVEWSRLVARDAASGRVVAVRETGTTSRGHVPLSLDPRFKPTECRGVHLSIVSAPSGQVLQTDYFVAGRPLVLGGKFAALARSPGSQGAVEVSTVRFVLDPVDLGDVEGRVIDVEVDLHLRTQTGRVVAVRLCGSLQQLPQPMCDEYDFTVVGPISDTSVRPEFGVLGVFGTPTIGTISAMLYLPSDADIGSRTGPGGSAFPLVMLGTGTGFGPESYDTLASCLAASGFIVWLFGALGDPQDPVSRALAALHNFYYAADFLAASPYDIDFSSLPDGRLAFVGQSTGGEAAAIVPRYIRTLQEAGLLPDAFADNAPAASPVAAVVALAPPNQATGFNATSELWQMSGYLMIRGDIDEDVLIEESVQEFDTITPSALSGPTYSGFLVVEGMSHARMTDGDIQDLTDAFAGFPSDVALRLSRPTQQALVNHYVVSFLRWRVELQQAYRPWFTTAPLPDVDMPVADQEKIALRRLFFENPSFVATSQADLLGPTQGGFTLVKPGLVTPTPDPVVPANWMIAPVYAPADEVADLGEATHFPRQHVVGGLVRLKWSGGFVSVRFPVSDPWGNPVLLAGSGPLEKVWYFDVMQAVPNSDFNTATVEPVAGLLMTVAVHALDANGEEVVAGAYTAEVGHPRQLSAPSRTKSYLETLSFALEDSIVPVSPGFTGGAFELVVAFLGAPADVFVSLPRYGVA